MNTVKRFFGAIWMLLAVVAGYYLVINALSAIGKANKAIADAGNDAARALAEAAKTNASLQWGIIVIIFIPIAVGLIIFGKYAISGEYDLVKK